MPQNPSTPAWKALQAHFDQIHSTTIAEYFAQDANRADAFTLWRSLYRKKAAFSPAPEGGETLAFLFGA